MQLAIREFGSDPRTERIARRGRRISEGLRTICPELDPNAIDLAARFRLSRFDSTLETSRILTDAEYQRALECFKQSANYAFSILRDSLGDERAETVKRIIEDHLETFDGRGPKGKKGNEVLAAAYVLNLSVAIENMLEGRPNRNASEQADSLLGRIVELADRQYPKIIVSGSITPLEELLREEDGWWETLRLAQLGRFASIILHDMGTPLTAFSMSVEYFKTQPLDGGAMMVCDECSEAVTRLTNLRNELLEFSQGRSKKVPGDLNTTLDEALKFLITNLRPINVVKRYGDLPSYRYHIPEMKHVFLNLIKNAVEAMEGKGGSLLIMTSVDRGHIHISISDDGAGMTPEGLRRAFSGRTTKERGSGLGLPFCKHVVEEHDGLITLESMLGKGTSAHIWLPLEKAELEKTPRIDAKELYIVAHVVVDASYHSIEDLITTVAPRCIPVGKDDQAAFFDDSTGLRYYIMRRGDGNWQVTISRKVIDNQELQPSPDNQAQRLAELAGERKMNVMGCSGSSAPAVRMSSGHYVSLA